jgi:hypothetical protein
MLRMLFLCYQPVNLLNLREKSAETMPAAFFDVLLWGVMVLMAPPLSSLPRNNRVPTGRRDPY